MSGILILASWRSYALANNLLNLGFIFGDNLKIYLGTIWFIRMINFKKCVELLVLLVQSYFILVVVKIQWDMFIVTPILK